MPRSRPAPTRRRPAPTKSSDVRAALAPYDWSLGLESRDASDDERSAFKRATDIWNILHKAPKNGETIDPLDLFAEAAKKAGDDPAAFIAFAKLAGPDHALVKMAVDSAQGSGEPSSTIWDRSIGKAPALITVANPLGEALGADPLAPTGPPDDGSSDKGATPATGQQDGPIVWGPKIDDSHWNATVMGRPAVVAVGVDPKTGQGSMIVTFKNAATVTNERN